MRCFQRVARSAAPFRDRPAVAMRHAHPCSQFIEPFDETVTCGSVPQAATHSRSPGGRHPGSFTLRRPVGASGGEPFNGRVT